MNLEQQNEERWYRGITRYQWLVLLIASLGWVFDIFEGQYFVASMNEAMPSLIDKSAVAAEEGLTDPRQIEQAFKGRIAVYNNYAFGAFLLGGALGGIIFGMLSDRIGRKRTMSLTIAFYSVFTCLSAFSQQWWHLAGLRFLVAMGVGGEWAVASSMVAEVFPRRARAHVGAIFHASSVFGTLLAVIAGTFLIGNVFFLQLGRTFDMPSLPWRIGFAIGVLPAFLIIWIRTSLHEPEAWQEARRRGELDKRQKTGSLWELFGSSLFRNTFVGVTLAAIGMATFWGAHIYGKNLLLRDARAARRAAFPPEELAAMSASIRNSLLAAEDPPDEPSVDAALSNWNEELRAGDFEILLDRSDLEQLVDPLKKAVGLQFRDRIDALLKRWEMLGMLLVTVGGGIGLVAFGPICHRIGRRKAFLFFHAGGLVMAVVSFQLLSGVGTLLIALPIFGFLTLGMHAGYAIYFPELFPTRLRGTGAGFCFNAGRIIAAPILFFSGWMQRGLVVDSRDTWIGPWLSLRFELFPVSLENAATFLSLLFVLGFIVLFGPETRGRDLME